MPLSTGVVAAAPPHWVQGHDTRAWGDLRKRPVRRTSLRVARPIALRYGVGGNDVHRGLTHGAMRGHPHLGRMWRPARRDRNAAAPVHPPRTQKEHEKHGHRRCCGATKKGKKRPRHGPLGTRVAGYITLSLLGRVCASTKQGAEAWPRVIRLGWIWTALRVGEWGYIGRRQGAVSVQQGGATAPSLSILGRRTCAKEHPLRMRRRRHRLDDGHAMSLRDSEASFEIGRIELPLANQTGFSTVTPPSPSSSESHTVPGIVHKKALGRSRRSKPTMRTSTR